VSKKKDQVPTIRSSAAEYLTFVAASGEGGVEAVYADEDVWLTQKMLGTLYIIQDCLFESDFDKQIKALEKQHKNQINAGGDDE
jgi:hypothetical protein